MTVSVIQITVSHVMATDIQYNYNISCRLIPVCLGSEISQRLIFCCTKCTARSHTIHCKSFGSPSSAVEDLCPPGHDAGSLDKQFWHFEQLQCLPNSRNCLHNNTAARNLESSNLHYARKRLSCVKLLPLLPKKSVVTNFSKGPRKKVKIPLYIKYLMGRFFSDYEKHKKRGKICDIIL